MKFFAVLIRLEIVLGEEASMSSEVGLATNFTNNNVPRTGGQFDQVSLTTP